MSKVFTETDKSELIKLTKAIGGIEVVYDIGSRDALDGIELYQRTQARELHVFECNPPSAKVCKSNLNKYNLGEPQAYFNELAISDKEEKLTFHPIDTEKTVTVHKDGNPGASSIFMANPNYPKETYVQKSIEVQASTIKKYCEKHSKPDLLWLDVQGAELMVLNGAQDVLDSVKIINLEVGFRPTYINQPLFFDLDAFLVAKGFELYHIDTGRWPKLIWLFKLLKTGPWVGNAIYVNKKNYSKK